MITEEQKTKLKSLAIKNYGIIKPCSFCIKNPEAAFAELRDSIIYWFNSLDKSTHIIGINKFTLEEIKVRQKNICRFKNR